MVHWARTYLGHVGLLILLRRLRARAAAIPAPISLVRRSSNRAPFHQRLDLSRQAVVVERRLVNLLGREFVVERDRHLAAARRS